MPEGSPKREIQPRYVPAYFGTTFENFQKCAVVTETGVVFEKGRESRHTFLEDMQFVPSLSGGANYATARAKELGHTPLILKGEIDQRRNYRLLNEPFLIKAVWVPREGLDWREYRPFSDTSDPEQKESHRFFEVKSPTEVMQTEPQQ